MDLADRFAASHGQPVEVEGRTVHALYLRELSPGQTFTVSLFSKPRPGLVQGLRIKVTRGTLTVARTNTADIVLWADTAPRTVELRYGGPKNRDLKVWNCWRDQDQVMQAWIGNAGMVVEERGMGRVVLRCNIGPALSFDDLRAELDFAQAKAAMGPDSQTADSR
ncbi:MAG TPA: hypothetical protein VGQ83_04850 [Polyangia bacterium]|jgi:hypothetical protein